MGKIMRFASEAYVQSEVETRLKTAEPQDSDIPKVFINGTIPTTKDDVNAELTGRFAKGILNDCRIYNVALTDDQLEELLLS